MISLRAFARASVEFPPPVDGAIELKKSMYRTPMRTIVLLRYISCRIYGHQFRIGELQGRKRYDRGHTSTVSWLSHLCCNQKSDSGDHQDFTQNTNHARSNVHFLLFYSEHGMIRVYISCYFHFFLPARHGTRLFWFCHHGKTFVKLM